MVIIEEMIAVAVVKIIVIIIVAVMKMVVVMITAVVIVMTVPNFIKFLTRMATIGWVGSVCGSSPIKIYLDNYHDKIIENHTAATAGTYYS